FRSYPFSLGFDAYDAPGFIGNGSTPTPYLVDLINENFTSYTVSQIQVPVGGDPDCNGQATNGWVIGTGTCTGCVGSTLSISSDKNNCTQNATAQMSFTPTAASVNISFAYRFLEISGTTITDSFRVY